MGSLSRLDTIKRRSHNIFDPLKDGKTTPIFVFKSNLAGQMLSTTALTAKRFFLAKSKAEGPVGNSYALPTGAHYDRDFPQQRLLIHYGRLFEWASKHPSKLILLPRIGCNSDAINEGQIRQFALEEAPHNIILPGTWERHACPKHGLVRLFLYGASYLTNEEVFAAVDHMTQKVRATTPPENIEIIIPPREDGAKRAHAYAKERGYAYRSVIPLQQRLRENDTLAAHFTFWYATHSILLYSSDPRFEAFHRLDRYGNLARFSDIALHHRVVLRWTDIEDIRPALNL